MHEDTIAAIATAAGEGGIAIVRMSGPAALAVADRIFCGNRKPSRVEGGRFIYGTARGTGPENRQTLDEAVVLIYRAPASYTREDVVEFQVHGGMQSARRVLRACLESGARPAEPGEFTRRAFLNGRIDLLQAEAVADLIQARSDRAASAAMEQLEGRLSTRVNALYDQVLAIAADIEATLDFVEEDLPETVLEGLTGRLSGACREVMALLETWEEGHLLREGALVVISGKPNVGKSTLMNTLLGKNRAIVTEIAGTTRDTLEEQLILAGVPLRLVDTAGIREVDCMVEREGIRRARDSMERADINIHMLDASEPAGDGEIELIQRLDPDRTIVLRNKTDLGHRDAGIPAEFACISCALIRGEGVEDILDALTRKLGQETAGQPHAVISERHRALAQSARENLVAAVDLVTGDRGDAVLLAAEHLRDALESLGLVTGRMYSSELLDSIFSRFCVGK